MSCTQDAATALRTNGKRVTSARIAVISTLRHAGGHMTPPQVIEAVRKATPHIDASTVYRTLSGLAASGIVAETRLGHGDSLYEWTDGEAHHHLRCGQCGALSKLDPAAFASFSATIQTTDRFRIESAHMVFDGVCHRCALKSGPGGQP